MNTVISGSDEPSPTPTFEALTYLQKERFHYLKGYIDNDDVVLDLVLLIDHRGRNKFDAVVEKLEKLNNAKQDECRYYGTLYDKFKIGKVFTSSDIIKLVSESRREVGLKPFTSNFKQNCQSDFFDLFIVHEASSESEVDGVLKKQTLGYIPIYKLLID